MKRAEGGVVWRERQAAAAIELRAVLALRGGVGFTGHGASFWAEVVELGIEKFGAGGGPAFCGIV